MKILMTADAVGGVWTYAVELARALSHCRVQVAIATMGPRPTPSQRAQIHGIPGATLHESDFQLEWMDDPWTDVEQAGNWLLCLEYQLKPDVVHLNGYAHGTLPWTAPTVVAAHSCVLSWWLAVHGGAAPEKDWKAYREKVCAGLAAADHVVAPTRAMLRSVQELYGRARGLSAIPNGREACNFYACMEKKPYVASAGRLWDEAKNIAAIERIAGELEWPVCLAGASTPPSRAFAASRPNTCSSFGHLGREAFAQFLGRASIFCLPARYEPFGLSILEAALSRCALVIGDIPSLRENWEGAAVFVRPDSDRDLANALRELIADRGWRAELAAKARQRGLEFTPDRMAAGYLQLYAGLLTNRKRLNEPAQAGTCAS